ncbi:MAG: hypothetical protein ACC660_00790, partial [Acidimicrobiales bacterium]
AAWPVPDAVSAVWYLDSDGLMGSEPVPSAMEESPPSSYVADPKSVPDTFYEGGSSGVWRAVVTYDWRPIPDRSGVAWMTEPLEEDTVA